MIEQSAPSDLRRIWKQDDIPVIVRKGAGHKLRIKVPGRQDDLNSRRRVAASLQAARPTGHYPEWLAQYSGWQLPQSWFSDLVNHLLRNFGKVYVIQPHNPQEKCASRCMNAKGHECECSCLGAHHGEGGPGAGWFEVSETFATRWGGQRLACRLMVRTSAQT